MTVTIYDVAKRSACLYGHSVAVLLMGTKMLKAETKNKVNEVIKRLNYRPNAVC